MTKMTNIEAIAMKTKKHDEKKDGDFLKKYFTEEKE